MSDTGSCPECGYTSAGYDIHTILQCVERQRDNLRHNFEMACRYALNARQTMRDARELLDTVPGSAGARDRLADFLNNTKPPSESLPVMEGPS